MSYQKAHAMANYSDLLMSSSTKMKLQNCNKLVELLQKVNKDEGRKLLITELKNKQNRRPDAVEGAEFQTDSALALSSIYHKDLISMLRLLAED